MEQEIKDKDKATLQIEKDLLSLFQHPGWQHIRSSIEIITAGKIELLIKEKDQDEKQRLQAEIKALRKIPEFIVETMQAADNIRELKQEEQDFITESDPL
jgi:ATP sulfurylase